MNRPHLSAVLLLLIALLLGACAPASPAIPGAGRTAPQPPAIAPKSFVMAISAEPSTLGPFQVGGTSHQGPVYQVLHDFLVVHGDQGQAIPHLAEERPSQAQGTWLVAPDGSMETT